MPQAHRHTDLRVCGAKTNVTHQTTVFVNNLLWAVQGDLDDHCNTGALKAEIGFTIKIQDILIIVIGDDAYPDYPDCLLDPPPHNKPRPSTGSPNVFAYSA
jgi:hypothetical protein